LTLKHLKRIDEFFQDTGAFGDTYGYGGANGTFKVSYKPYKDLSVSVGPDKDIKRNVDGAQFQIGDIVIGNLISSDKKVIGMIVRSERTTDNKGYRYFIQIGTKKSGKNKKMVGEKVVEISPATIEFFDNGKKGHQEIARGFGVGDIPSDAYNSQEVINNQILGIEATY
jgi:hypothetical protein